MRNFPLNPEQFELFVDLWIFVLKCCEEDLLLKGK